MSNLPALDSLQDAARNSEAVASPQIHVMWLGLRGFPGVQGGVETHAQALCRRLAARGFRVTALVRARYQPCDYPDGWNGVRLVKLWCPKARSLETFVHTLLGVLYAGIVSRPDILHIHAIGPGLFVPMARLMGLRVVATHHGPDYDRQKWGRFAKRVLRFGEWAAMKGATRRIVISKVIQQLVQGKYGEAATLIPNGIERVEHPSTAGALSQFQLQRGRYILLVSRLVPEKRHLDLLEAFVAARLDGWKLALVGDADHGDAYVDQVRRVVAATPGAVATGFQTGLALHELYAHAGLFVLPSSHEGHPIALLEALSYGVAAIASDIPANLEVGLPANCYFELGNIDSLAQRLIEFAGGASGDGSARASRSRWAAEQFSWDKVADATASVYRDALPSAVAKDSERDGH